MYRGKHGIVGMISFSLVGILYKIFGTSSKLFGKILFAIFIKAIPKIFKSIVELIINIF